MKFWKKNRFSTYWWKIILKGVRHENNSIKIYLRFIMNRKFFAIWPHVSMKKMARGVTQPIIHERAHLDRLLLRGVKTNRKKSVGDLLSYSITSETDIFAESRRSGVEIKFRTQFSDCFYLWQEFLPRKKFCKFWKIKFLFLWLIDTWNQSAIFYNSMEPI